MSNDKKKLFKIIIAFAAVYTVWGTTYLAIGVAVESMPPFLVAGVRFLAAGLLMVVLMRLRGVPAPRGKQWPVAFLVGALMVGGGSGLLHWAEQYIPTGISALVIATIPLWIAFFDWILFKNGRPGGREISGLLLGFLGIVLLIGPGQLQGTVAFSWTAIIILLLSPIFWSYGSLYSRQANMPQNAFMASGVEMLCGGLVLIAAGLLTGEGQELDLAAMPPVAWFAFIYLLIFGSLVGFTAYTYLLKTVSAAKASTYSYVNPVIAVYLGWLILDEPISMTTIAAMAIILVAVFLITTSRTPQPVRELAPEAPGHQP